MRRFLLLIFSLTIGFFTISCDCYQNVSGKVIDFQTEEPIEGVFVQNQRTQYDYKTSTYTYTDSSGYFELSSISGGLFGCPPMTVVVGMEGYDSTIVEIDAGGNKTIKLKRKR